MARRQGRARPAHTPCAVPRCRASRRCDPHPAPLPRAGMPCPLGGGVILYGCFGLRWRAAARQRSPKHPVLSSPSPRRTPRRPPGGGGKGEGIPETASLSAIPAASAQHRGRARKGQGRAPPVRIPRPAAQARGQGGLSPEASHPPTAAPHHTLKRRTYPAGQPEPGHSPPARPAPVPEAAGRGRSAAAHRCVAGPAPP